MVQENIDRLICIAMIIFFAVGGCNSIACAQTADEHVEDVKRITKRAVDIIEPKFRDTLDDYEIDLLDDDFLEIKEFLNFNAFADAKGKKVYLPVGLLVISEALINAYALTILEPSLASNFSPYLNYIITNYSNAAMNIIDGMSYMELMQFWQFAGLDEDECGRIMRTEKFQIFATNMYIDSLALIVAHETGHIAHGHIPTNEISSSESVKQEVEADMFAVELMEDAQMSVLPGVITSFIIFALLDQDGSDGSNTHPHPLCRIYAIAFSELEQIQDDPGAISGAEIFGTNVKNTMQQIELFKQFCNGEYDDYIGD